MTERIDETAGEEIYALPTSFAQQRLWLLDQLHPDAPVYNIPIAVRLEGPLDHTVLTRCFREIVQRHETLRTTYSVIDGNLVQLIASSGSLEPPLVDLSMLTAAERGDEVMRLLREEAELPFDLVKGPVLRAVLLRLAPEEHILQLTAHHIASDAWSNRVLMRELSALYRAFSSGETSTLPELPIQYGDYAIWQREWLQGELLERQIDYWSRTLAPPLPVIEIPTDRPRPAVQTFNGRWIAERFPLELAEKLRALSRTEGVTLFMTLLGAFQTLLSRYTGQEDIVVGSPIAGRTRSELEGLIGFFVNTLVLRGDLSGDPSFRELLRRVRDVALGAYAHQDLPFEKLVEHLQPERDTSRTPLFQVMFGLRDEFTLALDLPGIRSSELEIDNGQVKFDLLVQMVEGEQGLAMQVGYNTDIFEEATILRMTGHFRRLLDGIVADPDARLSSLEMMSPEEMEELANWNRTSTDYPLHATIQELFEQQVERSPDATAIVHDDQSVSYRELNQRANRLARYLRMQGVGAETLVGLSMERSIPMIVAMLGIIKAGGAYVPLDPTYPKERLALMVKDAATPVVIVDATGRDLFDGAAEGGPLLVDLDRDSDTIAQQPVENPDVVTHAESLAYVIYTSGSTGIPKGVAVTNRAVVGLVIDTDYVDLDNTDVIAQASNSSFDAATFEIWGALLHGGKLVVVVKDVLLAVDEFAATLERHGVTVLFVTTALFNHLAREAPTALGGLRHMLFGGEAVDPRWVERVLEQGPPARLLHVYGPTETTTYTTWFLIESVPDGATTIPIGGPLANTRAYLLDRHLRPVPLGIPGELYIGGDGLARGYLNHPGLTAEKFIPDPFSLWPGERLYRTGDVVRRRGDGNIEFMGRADHQVKLRGFRVELGEIEAALVQHGKVRQAAAVIREDQPGEKRLVAYLVPTDGGDILAPSELRDHLVGKLPGYMVPSAFVQLDALPITPNGKVDRHALPPPHGDAVQGESVTYSPPASELEQTIASIWQEELHLQRVGRHDNFFDLGGHSLLLAQVYNRLRHLLDRPVRLVDLFRCPTISSLASYLSNEEGSGVGGLEEKVKSRAEKQREATSQRRARLQRRG